MCGGIGFNIGLISEDSLLEYLSPEAVNHFKKTGRVEVFFWSPRPFLPVEIGGIVHLLDWGNRDKSIDLPQTGWARIESITRGLWTHLNPQEITTVPTLVK